MKSENLNVIILSPRRILSGAPNGDALDNINTTPLADGALCYVQTGVGQGIWQLQKSSAAVPDGTTIIAPASGGPGRWLLIVTPTAPYGRKYTVGPDWSGAQYQTIQAAVDAAVAEGHSTSVAGTSVEISLYPVQYNENVVVPATLPRVNFVGEGADVGAEVLGTFTVTVPDANGGFSASKIRFTGGFTLNQVAGTATVGVRFFNTYFAASTITTQTVRIEAWDCRMIGTTNWLYNAVDLTASWFVGNVTLNGNTELLACYGAFSGTNLITARGTTIGMSHCLIYYTALAVLDECTSTSEYHNNMFRRLGGATTPVINKTGAGGILHGGNDFLGGAVYPFITSVAAPSRSQTDSQIRSIFSVSGSPVLTAAQVGGQRKTTVTKTDGGGTVSLPAPNLVDGGCTVIVKDLNGNATASPISVNATGGSTIDGAASQSIATNYSFLSFQSNGTNWFRV